VSILDNIAVDVTLPCFAC